MKRIYILFALMLAGLAACSSPTLDMKGMIDGQSPDVNERQTSETGGLVMADNRTVMSISDEYKVYVGSDMHLDGNATTAHTDAFLSAYLSDPASPMVLILGDLVNGKENMHSASEHVREMAGRKSGALFMALGNHDIYFNLWEQWTGEWGKAHYTVVVRTPSFTDLYVCIDTASGYLGTQQLKWLRETLEDAAGRGFRHIIVYTHTHMFKKDMSQGHTSNYPMEESFELMGLFADNGVEMLLSGHSHSRDVSAVRGVRYIVLDALEEHYPDDETGYLVLSVGDGLDYRFVSMAK